MAGVVLWLDAAAGVRSVGDAIEWEDQSGNGHVASVPKGRTSPSLAGNAVAGQPAIRFNGSSDTLLIEDDESLQLGTGPFTIVMAASHTTSNQTTSGRYPYGCFLSKQASSSVGPSLWGNTRDQKTQVAAQLKPGSAEVFSREEGLNDGSPLVLWSTRHNTSTGARFELSINGGEPATSSSSEVSLDVSTPSAPLYLGASFNDTQYLRGDIAELLIIKGELGAEDEQDLRTYMLDKYSSQ